MADGFDISLLGDKALSRKLAKLPAAVQRKVLRPALRKGGKVILEAVRRNIPVDEGKLRKTLKLRALKAKRGRIGVEVRTGTREELDIPAGAEGYYPAHVELGTRNRSATPYLRPAMDDKESQVVSLLKTEIGLGITREAKRI